VQLDLSHREATNLFPALIDQELADREAARLKAHLDGCVECREDWDRYSRAVTLVRKVEREPAPPALTSTILRRVRRRRFRGLRALEFFDSNYRFPYEVLLPILLAALVAALLLFASQ